MFCIVRKLYNRVIDKLVNPYIDHIDLLSPSELSKLIESVEKREVGEYPIPRFWGWGIVVLFILGVGSMIMLWRR